MTAPEAVTGREVFVFAIEVLIFITPTLTNLFVSKADSSGFASKLKLPRSSSNSPTKVVVETFLDHLIRPRLSEERIVISLFARSQNQYLFPGSIENPEKRVLGDRQLIKWWARVLDAVWRPYDMQVSPPHETSAYIVVPGCDGTETRSFFPATSGSGRDTVPKWSNAYPVRLMVDDPARPLRCLIPRLPDDPKARFLTDLDSDYTGKDGQWRSIRTLPQFWDMMSYRQECAAGRLVGFIWIVFRRKYHAENGLPLEGGPSSFSALETSTRNLFPTPAASQQLVDEQNFPPQRSELEALSTLQSPPPTSPLVAPRDQENTKLSSLATHHESNASNNHQQRDAEAEAAGATNGHHDVTPPWPEASQGQIIVDGEKYEPLIEYLLSLDFAGYETAIQSTGKFIDEAMKAAEASDFGIRVTGKKLPDVEALPKPETAPQVTMLTGIRKKRKPEDLSAGPDIGQTPVAVQELPMNTMRKKPKMDK